MASINGNCQRLSLSLPQSLSVLDRNDHILLILELATDLDVQELKNAKGDCFICFAPPVLILKKSKTKICIYTVLNANRI